MPRHLHVCADPSMACTPSPSARLRHRSRTDQGYISSSSWQSCDLCIWKLKCDYWIQSHQRYSRSKSNNDFIQLKVLPRAWYTEWLRFKGNLQIKIWIIINPYASTQVMAGKGMVWWINQNGHKAITVIRSPVGDFQYNLKLFHVPMSIQLLQAFVTIRLHLTNTLDVVFFPQICYQSAAICSYFLAPVKLLVWHKNNFFVFADGASSVLNWIELNIW